MTSRKARIVRAAAVLAAAAVTVLGGVLPASANIDASSVKVTDPTSNEVISGSYGSDGPTGFKITFKGTATTSCASGWQTIKFTVTGPSYSTFFNVTAPNTQTWSGSAPSAWDTQPLRNGTYDVRLDVREKDTLSLACNGQAASTHVPVKVANPAEAPEWSSAPSAAGDGSASVTLRWKKNAEEDVLEYRIVRSGPDGTKVAPVSASSPGGQGCSLSSGVYTCEDKSFPADYSGSYSYGLVALRERPAYNSSEDDKVECATVSKPCVVSAAGQIHTVSLAAPTPTPSPSSQPNKPTSGSTATTPSKKPKAGSGGSSGSPSVLSFGNDGGFYSGTFSEQLPYTPRTMILGGGSVTSSQEATGYDGDVVDETAPDYRTIMLPIAGGLLAFLSAAHVRRLMLRL